MFLKCRREHRPPKDLGKMLLQSLRKVGEFHNIQPALLMESPPFEALMMQLKNLKISRLFLPYFLSTMKRSMKYEELTHRIVFRFVSNILKPFLANQFASSHDRRVFLQYLKHFIGMRYGGSISTRIICQNFVEISHDDGTVTKALSHATVYVLLAGVAASVLHTHFRWCECKTEVPTVSYFFQEGWSKLTTKVLSVLVPTLSPLDDTKFGTVLIEQSRFQPLLPKHTDAPSQPFVVVPSRARFVFKSNRQRFRLVINASCARRNPLLLRDNPGTWIGSSGLPKLYKPISTNQRLKFVNGLAEFLERLRFELPAVYAPSTLSVSSAFDTLISFRSAAYASGHTRFWLAKLDLLDCFHCIDHDRLIAVFLEVCSLANQFMYPKPDIDHLERELHWFLKNACILLEQKPFVFTQGIPQGSCVSSDLTNLYLAHADRILQGPLNLWTPKRTGAAAEALVVRYLDDYLCAASTSETLTHIVDKLRENLNNYGLAFNESKIQTNISRFNANVSWLGMEIRNNLSIVLPESPPPTFCRYAGQPLSADECLARLRRSRLQRVGWRYAFRPMPAGCGRINPVLTLNACRLGVQLADLFWITVKTSPERVRLLQPRMAKRLAYIIRGKLSFNVGPRQYRLERLARNAFLQRLRPHRGELIHVFRALRVCSRSSTGADEPLSQHPARG